MEIIVYALDIEAKVLKKHFSTNVRFEKCDVCAKNLDFLKNLSRDDHVTNIGVCAGTNIGQIYLCNKIIGDKTYYPDILIKSDLEQKRIKTVDYVVGPDEVENNTDTLFDQEAAIIFKESTKYISPHQISFLKIVSDTGVANFDNLRKRIPKIIENKVPEIESFISSSKKLFSQIGKKEEIKDLEKYSEMLKCSVTMKAQLAQLLRYAQIIDIDIDKYFKNLKAVNNKRESIEALNKFNLLLISKTL